MIGTAVIDASVGIKLFVNEPGTARAEGLFAGLATAIPSNFYVPDLFYIECANILWKYVQRFDYPVDEARSHLEDLRVLSLHEVASGPLLNIAFEVAVAYGTTVYDACYIALAIALDAPLVTADEKLARRIPTERCMIHLLEELG